NPLPRRTVELAERYGHELAAAVDQVLAGPLQPIMGRAAATFAIVDLPYQRLPTREGLQAQLGATDPSDRRLARSFLARFERDGRLPATYPYPVQSWRLGGLTWVALGGEVVVDYSLRLKRELGAGTWIAAYCNDVMNYIPSARVLAEGGYEGGDASRPYA